VNYVDLVIHADQLAFPLKGRELDSLGEHDNLPTEQTIYLLI